LGSSEVGSWNWTARDGKNDSLLLKMAIEMVDLPSYKMVDLSIVMWLFTGMDSQGCWDKNWTFRCWELDVFLGL